MDQEKLVKVFLYSQEDLQEQFKKKIKEKGLSMSSWFRLKQKEFLQEE